MTGNAVGVVAAGAPARCSVCALGDRLPEMERLREQGATREQAASQFGVTVPALRRHENAGHHSTLLADRPGQREIDRRIARFKAASLKALKAGDVRAAVDADRYAAELQEKATAAGSGGGWAETIDVILKALEPDARLAVSDALAAYARQDGNGG